jgi:hypothetical protein
MSAKSLEKVVSNTYSTPIALKNAVNLDATYNNVIEHTEIAPGDIITCMYIIPLLFPTDSLQQWMPWTEGTQTQPLSANCNNYSDVYTYAHH